MDFSKHPKAFLDGILLDLDKDVIAHTKGPIGLRWAWTEVSVYVDLKGTRLQGYLIDVIYGLEKDIGLQEGDIIIPTLKELYLYPGIKHTHRLELAKIKAELAELFK